MPPVATLPHLFSLDYLELDKKTPDLEVSDQGGHGRISGALGRSMVREKILRWPGKVGDAVTLTSRR